MPKIEGRVAPEQRASEILSRFDSSDIPVDVRYLAGRLGATIFYQDYPDETSGILFRDVSKTVISVNRKHHRHRQRFTLAHEIGHLVLHPGRRVVIESDLRVNLRTTTPGAPSTLEEAEANQFAAALLMPAPSIRFELDRISLGFEEIDSQMITRLAKRFDVSVRAMEVRLSVLGLYQPH